MLIVGIVGFFDFLELLELLDVLECLEFLEFGDACLYQESRLNNLRKDTRRMTAMAITFSKPLLLIELG